MAASLSSNCLCTKHPGPWLVPVTDISAHEVLDGSFRALFSKRLDRV